jgi:glycosyltransferase involved in cell wall biosynthesis
MSSLTEGMPLVLLEAMQWRVPILATSVGAIPALLEPGRRGLLVPPGDVAALTAGLLRMWHTPGQQPRADAGQPAAEPYGSSQMAQRYLDVYRALSEPRS